MGELIDKLTEYGKSNFYPFHMPGHKRNIEYIGNIYKQDITEIEDFDDLHDMDGILLKLTERISKKYNANKSFILVNGSTSGIQIAIKAVTNLGDDILIARNCHKSVYNTCLLGNLNVDYIYPHIFENTGITGKINPENVEKKLKFNNKIKAVVITSPTYEGIVSDIKIISEICHKYNVPLIVDAAHGAHFGMSEYLPDNPLNLGADIVIMSLHKTLPSVTQTAIMCIKSEIINMENINRYFHIFMTSSPSYLFMAAIENCFDIVENYNFKEYYNKLNFFYSNCNLKKLNLFRTDDIGKIIITTDKTDISGMKLMEILRNRYQLEMEMASAYYVVAMTGIMDSDEGYRRLSDALMEIDKNINYKINYKKNYNFKIETQMTIYDAILMEGEYCRLEDVEGRISKEFIFAYPPGIPIVAPGEVISAEIIKYILNYKKMGIKFKGLNNNNNILICKNEKE